MGNVLGYKEVDFSELFGVVSHLHILAIFAVDKQYIKQQSAIPYIYIYVIFLLKTCSLFV